MREDQRDLFISIARAGITCGLNHPFEWLVNWNRSLTHWAKYEDLAAKELEAYECYAALYDDTAPEYHPSVKDIEEMVTAFYSKNDEKLKQAAREA